MHLHTWSVVAKMMWHELHTFRSFQLLMLTTQVKRLVIPWDNGDLVLKCNVSQCRKEHAHVKCETSFVMTHMDFIFPFEPDLW